MYGLLCCRRELDVSVLLELGWNSCICSDVFQIWYHPLPKFQNDHLFFETEEYVILLDGVILNIDELMTDSCFSSWKECFLALHQKGDIPSCLRGSFRGLVYDKNREALIAFTNQTGEKTIYYRCESDIGLVVASHANIIKALFESNGMRHFEPDLRAHYELLLTGTVLHGKTPFKGIGRLTAGKMLFYQDETIEISVYHRFTNVPEHKGSLDECVEKADILLRQAVDRIFRKSREYGYKAECDLSGGLDSRLATWVAHDLGYKDVLNICYCVEGNLDHKVSEQIAHDLGNEYYFLPMDAFVMGDVDKKTLLNGGQVVYTLSTGALHVLENIVTSNIGLCCTGLLGEMQNAYWTEGIQHTKARYIGIRELVKASYINLDIPDSYADEYENYEQMNIYEYSYNAFALSGLVRQEYVEIASPFFDVDYMDYIFKIPLKWRKNYIFSQSLMCKKYSKAASYVWLTKRMPVDKHFKHELYLPKVLGDVRNLGIRCTNKVLQYFHVNHRFVRNNEMNPFEAWYRNNNKIRDYIDTYFIESIEFVSNERLKNVLSNMFRESLFATDKIQVINLLAVWKNYLR